MNKKGKVNTKWVEGNNKNKADIDEIEKKHTIEKFNKAKVGSLNRSMKFVDMKLG